MIFLGAGLSVGVGRPLLKLRAGQDQFRGCPHSPMLGEPLPRGPVTVAARL
ncbi:MAG TPA: hypothetical protein VHT27_04515 [Solirubrobacteraceae bacterium]|jgi:hypothetical protein|nr:hypothetical protein [Solirubrobacteraceae bacterium]